MLKKYLGLLVGVVVACDGQAAKQQVRPAATVTAPTVIYVVRHAEKQATAPGAEDPALSERGLKRAEALAERLKEVPIQAVFVSPYQRTQQTAAPLATLKKLIPQVRDAQRVMALTEEIVSHHKGEVLLVVGHSNTVGELLNQLGTPSPVVLDERDFGDLFIVTRPTNGPVTLSRERFGDAAP